MPKHILPELWRIKVVECAVIASWEEATPQEREEGDVILDLLSNAFTNTFCQEVIDHG